jgi:uncharacterized membrane protein YfcA
MAFAAFPAVEMRATALLLNIVAAGYAAWHVHRKVGLDQKMLLQIAITSLLAAFVGGLLKLDGGTYFVLTGLLLLAAAALMIFRRAADSVEAKAVHALPAALMGTGAGFISGLTGGVFLTPLLIAFGWASPKSAARLSPPFILCNSVVGLLGVLIAGQRLTSGTPLYAIGALAGAVLGWTVALRWMSERATRYVLAVILLLAGLRLLLR